MLCERLVRHPHDTVQLGVLADRGVPAILTSLLIAIEQLVRADEPAHVSPAVWIRGCPTVRARLRSGRVHRRHDPTVGKRENETVCASSARRLSLSLFSLTSPAPMGGLGIHPAPLPHPRRPFSLPALWPPLPAPADHATAADRLFRKDPGTRVI